MALEDHVLILKDCRISPPPGSVAQSLLPLTFLDHNPYLLYLSPQRLLFYGFPCSKSTFMDEIIPRLEQSLSLTLKHFYPFAGNLIFPPDSGKPEIHYNVGDSISLIFAESRSDFDGFTGNQPRNASGFYSFLPTGCMIGDTDITRVEPLAAIQVTLFPNSGICVGFRFRHAMCDGLSFANFVNSWALIEKSGGEEAFLESEFQPFYDRTGLRRPEGLELETKFWSKVQKFDRPQPPTLASNQVRATFVMDQATIQRLKKLVTTHYPSLSHVSSFTVTCGYVWSCMVKANAAVGEDIGQDEMEHFRFRADCRSFVSPPLPGNYFGNCALRCVASAKRSQLRAQNGFLVAAKSIGERILHHKSLNEEGLLKRAEDMMAELEASKGKRIFSVSESQWINFNKADFGWGKPKTTESIYIDELGSMLLGPCMNAEGDLDIGLSLPADKMEAFASFFLNGRQDCNLLQECKLI